MPRRFTTLDVFTETRFAGNPLAVVHDGSGLSDAAMQAIAREFNLSETVFVLPAAAASHRAKLRIFTPAAEVPFAGHPVIGTAALLGLLDGGSEARRLVVETGLGAVPCWVSPQDGPMAHAEFDLPQLPQATGAPPETALLAAALGLAPEEIGFAGFASSCWSAGIGFIYVPVRSRDVLRRARADLARFARDLTAPAHRAVFLFCHAEAPGGADYHARMFAPAYGVPEDPATGSACAAFAAVLAQQAGLDGGTHQVVIAQGEDMGRPSRIDLGLALRGGALAGVTVGGSAVTVLDGAITA